MSIPEYIVATPAELLGDLNEVEAKYAPKQLFLAGHTDIMRRGPRVSIVGSRKASAEGLRRAQGPLTTPRRTWRHRGQWAGGRNRSGGT